MLLNVIYYYDKTNLSCRLCSLTVKCWINFMFVAVFDVLGDYGKNPMSLCIHKHTHIHNYIKIHTYTNMHHVQARAARAPKYIITDVIILGVFRKNQIYCI